MLSCQKNTQRLAGRSVTGGIRIPDSPASPLTGEQRARGSAWFEPWADLPYPRSAPADSGKESKLYWVLKVVVSCMLPHSMVSLCPPPLLSEKSMFNISVLELTVWVSRGTE